MLTVHTLRIELGKSYRVAVDLISEMAGVLEEIGLTRLPHDTVLRTGLSGFQRRRDVRFSASQPRNALVTLLSIRLALTAISPAATTPTARTTASGC